MKRELFFTIVGIVGALFGLGFLLFPELSLRTYGVPTDPHNLMQSRYFGSALLGLGLVYLLARDTRDPLAVRALLVTAVVSNTVGAWLSASAAGSLQNQVAWLSVVIYVGFAAAAACYLMAGKQQIPAQSA